MKKNKFIIFLLSFLAVIFSICTFLILINFNIVYYYFERFSTLVFLIFPLLSVAILVLSSILIFKKNKIVFIVPVTIALVGCLLAFVLSNDASLSKIETDYLKYENQFNSQITKLENKNEGTYNLDDDSLKQIIPVNKVQIISVGNNKYAYFFIALDTPDRYEGYVYIPYGTPEEWDIYGAFTEDSLDINGKWYYMSLLK
ncbi:MAG: hypothetical protein E7365_00380 [Clostridiales bacterium]|nr:hypothetical protein [Clostridiales bacterium]